MYTGEKMKEIEKLDFIERRLHSRYSVHYLTDVYLGHEILFATVIDIAKDGVGIILPKGFYEHKVLSLRINCIAMGSDEIYDEFEKIYVHFKAEIMWIKPQEGMYRAGLKIINMDFNDATRLKRLIKRLEGKMKKSHEMRCR